ncbi:MAG: hypothetical protein PF450_09110, partial [Bacteroidales bacterium]|jgi:hypothetical protein|nr:hypothetical protein [Bacteroidales bacterium]
MLLANNEREVSKSEKMDLSVGGDLGIITGFSTHDWDSLSVDDNLGRFWPPSPLREPFHSLFKLSPDEALKLLRELCNHAITAWRQLHRYSYEKRGTPIPLELIFPWGSQCFWGTDREYLWFRSMFAPDAIACGFMALEEWCFAELERGIPADELIQQVIDGNECIAILGIASKIALHTQTISETTLPLVTSQRLLGADQNRVNQELSSKANLMGFKPYEKDHFKAVQAANDKPVCKQQLSDLVCRFIFPTTPISKLVRDAIYSFKDELPYQYKEHRDIPEAQEDLTAQATRYAEFVELDNYHAYQTEEDSNQVAIVHISPSASSPENIARVEEATLYIKQTNLWQWASDGFEEKRLSDEISIEAAIGVAKEVDTSDLFSVLSDDNGEELAMFRGAVSATAAIVLNYREERTIEELNWARNVLNRAISLPEIPGSMWFPSSDIPWHQGIYVVRGLAADIRFGTVESDTISKLLGLIAHPLEVVSLAAIEEACNLWSENPKLTWSALILALSLCHASSKTAGHYGQPYHSLKDSEEAVNNALTLYGNEQDWPSLPLPPPAWVKVQLEGNDKVFPAHEYYGSDELTDESELWGEPNIFWRSKFAGKILKLIPIEKILSGSASEELQSFFEKSLDWTIDKNSPSWAKLNRRKRNTDIWEWTSMLSSRLGHLAGLIPISELHSRYLDQILQLDGENCWALLSPFTNTYICSYVYDSKVLHPNAIGTLTPCLERLLEDPIFIQSNYRSGELSGFDLPELVRIFMFVSVERAELAERFVNGDWSDIQLILPIIDRFIRAAGWARSVMDPFITLCERSKDTYPVEEFSEQMLSILGGGLESLKGWNEALIPSRIAELVHYFAYRDANLSQDVAHKLLQILDFLVDMGDRRSAALQLDQMFREVRL